MYFTIGYQILELIFKKFELRNNKLISNKF